MTYDRRYFVSRKETRSPSMGTSIHPCSGNNKMYRTYYKKNEQQQQQQSDNDDSITKTNRYDPTNLPVSQVMDSEYTLVMCVALFNPKDSLVRSLYSATRYRHSLHLKVPHRNGLLPYDRTTRDALGIE